MEASAGAGLAATVKVRPEDVPPPGAALTTVTVLEPTAARSVARIVAFNCVALTNVVERLAPFHCTCDAMVKPLPLTVSVNAPELAPAETGDIVVTAGIGLVCAVMVNVAACDVPPPDEGFTTVIAALPAAATSEPEITAVNCSAPL